MKAYPTDKEVIETIIEIGKRMYMRGFVAANDGNISARVSDTEIWTTPTGSAKGFLRPEDMVKTDLDGNILEGNTRPSSELKMHLRLYRENPNICAVTHAHPPVSTAFAAAGLALDIPVIQEAVVQLGVVPLAPFALPGSIELADSVVPFCKTYNGALLENHGALSWGRDLMEAFFRLESIEHYARILMYGKIIGQKPLESEQIASLLDIRKNLGITTGGIPKGYDQ